MITAGIDVGLEKTKVVIIKDGNILAKGISLSGGEGRADAVNQVWQDTLKAASLDAANVDKIVATGQGKIDVRFTKDLVTEPIADAKAARFLYPYATSVVDIGADETRVVTLGPEDTIMEVVTNQKCAAGFGIFMEYIARRLGMTLEELSQLTPKPDNKIVVNDGCCVFMELDALENLFKDASRDDVANAIITAAAVRLSSVLDDKIRPAKGTTVLIGGLTKNTALINALKLRTGIDFIIPENAEYGGALGAALLAAG